MQSSFIHLPHAVARRIRRGAQNVHRNMARYRLGGAGLYQRKIFCVGMNKTGTTSIERLMRQWHYDVAPQWAGERIFDMAGLHLDGTLFDWIDRYEAFQDVPFSFARIVPDLVARYPGARFILTIRNSEEWFASLKNHHFNLLRLPADAPPFRIAAALDACPYISPGYLGRIVRSLFDIPSDKMLYDRDYHITMLAAHDSAVRSAVPPDRLVEVDLAQERNTARLCAALGLPPNAVTRFPHANRRR